jgi:DNA-binding transcriptional ArsR family regulator
MGRDRTCSTEWLKFLDAARKLNHMVERSSVLDPAPELDAVFRSLSDPTRRSMLRMLADGERSVGELAEPFAMSFAGASKHVKVLEEAGLVRRTVRGRIHSCSLDPEPLAAADKWFDFYTKFWSKRLDALEEALDSERDNSTERTTK